MKQCNTCKQYLQLDFFSKSKQEKDGHQYKCKKCISLYRVDYKKKNKARLALQMQKYDKRIRAKKRGYLQQWRKLHPDKEKLYRKKYRLHQNFLIREWSRKRRIENPEKVRQKEIAYIQKNPEKVRLWKKVSGAKRRASKLQRTPKWADLKVIKEIYNNCPKGMVVDHILPLQGAIISGLHVEYNLQYLTPLENSRKKNRYPYES